VNNDVQQINQLFKYLTRSEEHSQEFETFIALLRGLKDFSSLLDFYGPEFVNILLYELLPQLEGALNKALVIETIVEATYGEMDLVTLNDLFNQYIVLLKEDATTLEYASRCLLGFVASGITPGQIFNHLATFKHKDFAVAVLALTNILSSDTLDTHSISFHQEVDHAHVMKQRTYYFTQFIVILHPLVAKYTMVSAINFVFTYENARIDWPFSQPGSTQRLIAAKILTEKEGQLFEELGKLLHDETVELSSPSISNMYHKMFAKKDPLEVIFTLPSAE
jgi:hypothetical protein